MFKFGFSDGEQSKERILEKRKSNLEWIPASVVQVTPSRVGKRYEPNEYTENAIHSDCKLKLVKVERALLDLTKDDCPNIIEAESQHSDLVPAKYEGGLKVWECSYDLGKYILEDKLEFKDRVVLDLGCGAGIIGLIALLKGATVHFQDYNVEVINTVTIPNVTLNFEDHADALRNCEFYCGDWESFGTLSRSTEMIEPQKYDYIFTSETIYNPENHRKLYEIFKNRLKQGGTGFVAAKTYYFGVGGGIRQFRSLIEEDGQFDVEVVWKSQQGASVIFPRNRMDQVSTAVSQSGQTQLRILQPRRLAYLRSEPGEIDRAPRERSLHGIGQGPVTGLDSALISTGLEKKRDR